MQLELIIKVHKPHESLIGLYKIFREIARITLQTTYNLLCQVFKRAEKDYIRSLKSVMTCTWGCSLVACWSKTVRRRFTLPEEQGTQLFCVQRQESQDNKDN
ncbi:unnamed protein product [Peronospora belbahrii]|uniref:Uncharacterized protein n=1 Tax=Peronospora belbahrii TaxID=622444 RepID=A0AAU9KPR2_9STRA|nr:unnamed protein product [Peronospora belbahrii]